MLRQRGARWRACPTRRQTTARGPTNRRRCGLAGEQGDATCPDSSVTRPQAQRLASLQAQAQAAEAQTQAAQAAAAVALREAEAARAAASVAHAAASQAACATAVQSGGTAASGGVSGFGVGDGGGGGNAPMQEGGTAVATFTPTFGSSPSIPPPSSAGDASAPASAFAFGACNVSSFGQALVGGSAAATAAGPAVPPAFGGAAAPPAGGTQAPSQAMATAGGGFAIGAAPSAGRTVRRYRVKGKR